MINTYCGACRKIPGSLVAEQYRFNSMYVDLHLATDISDWKVGPNARQNNDGGPAHLRPPLKVQKLVLHCLEVGFAGCAVAVTVPAEKLHRFRPFTIDFTEIRERVSTLPQLRQNTCLQVHDPSVDTSNGFVAASRLTIESSSLDQLQSLIPSSLVNQFYDLIAIKPSSQAEFSFLCNECRCVDIICIETQTRLPFEMRLKDIEHAVRRGIVFELSIASALRNPQSRRFLIANAGKISRLTRGKNIILSSGAASFLESRSPHDLANLGKLFGMTPEHARNGVLTVWRKARQHGGMCIIGCVERSLEFVV